MKESLDCKLREIIQTVGFSDVEVLRSLRMLASEIELKQSKQQESAYIGSFCTCNPYIPDTLEILKCLLTEPQWLDLLYSRSKPYEKLITQLKSINDDELTDLSVKSIALSINQTLDKTTFWIRQIYNDILELNEQSPELFKKPGIFYELNFRPYYYEGQCFVLYLEAPLAVNNEFHFPFIKAKVGSAYFYIERIIHHYCSDVCYQVVKLVDRQPNIYAHFLKAKNEFNNHVAPYQKDPDSKPILKSLLKHFYGFDEIPE